MTTHTTQREADERALFESWYQSLASAPDARSTGKWLDPSDGEIKPLQWPKEYFALVEKVIDGGEIILEYEMDFMRRSWTAWQAGRASTRAAPEVPTDRDQFVSTVMGKLDEYGLAVADGNDDWRSRVRGEIFNVLYDYAPTRAAPEAPDTCTVPPPGWHCTRAAGHTGPCAAHPVALSRNADQFAINFIEQRAAAYLQDHADTEPGTGAIVFEFGEAGRDYHSTLIELADDIRAALAATEKGPTA